MKRKLLSLILAGTLILGQGTAVLAADQIDAGEIVYTESDEMVQDADPSLPEVEEITEEVEEELVSEEEEIFQDSEIEVVGEAPFEDAEASEDFEIVGEFAEEEEVVYEDLAGAEEFEVTEEAVEAGASTVTLKLGKTNPLVNEDIDVTIKATNFEGIKDARIWHDDTEDWRYIDVDELRNSGSVTERMDWWRGDRPHMIYAEVTFDDWNDEWDGTGRDERKWVRSETKTFDVSVLGEIGTFEATFDKTSVKRGEEVKVSFTKAEHADHYWVDIEKWEGNDWEWYDHVADLESPGEATINTMVMQPGRYRLTGQACGSGYDGREAENGSVEIEVTESDVKKGTVVLTASKTTVETGEDLEFDVFAPEADWIEIFPSFSDGDDWRWDNRNEETRDYYRSEVSYGDARERVIVARAHYAGTEDTVDSEPLRVQVIAPKGVITMDLPSDLPVSIKKGSGLSFTVKKPANAEWVNVDIWYDPDQEDVDGGLFGKQSSGDIPVKLSASALSVIPEGRSVNIELAAGGRGYDQYETRLHVPIYTPDPSAVLTLGKTTGLINEEIEVKVTFASGKDMKAVRIWRDDENNWLWGNEFHSEDLESDGSLVVHTDWWNPGRHTVYAEVTFDDWNEAWDGTDYDGRKWFRSEAKALTLTAKGSVGDFTATLSQNSVNRGDNLNLVFTKAEHADGYWFDLEKWYEDRNEWDWCDFRGNNGMEEAGTLVISTAGLTEGSYRLIGQANGPGYRNREASNGYQPFEVKASSLKKGDVKLSISKTELDTDEDFEYTVLAPEAQWIEIYRNYEEDPYWYEDNWYMGGGDYYVDRRSYDRSGTFTVIARAHYSDEEEDYQDSDPVTITVTASKGDGIRARLPKELPSYLTPGDSLRFTVTKPENAVWMHVDVGFDDENDGYQDLFSQHIESSEFTVNIPAERLPGVDTILDININAGGPGYNAANDHRRIPVIVPSAKGVSFSADKKYALLNEEVQIVLESTDPARPWTAFRIIENGWYWENDEGDIVEFTAEEGENGRLIIPHYSDEARTCSFCAEVTFDEGRNNWYKTEAITIVYDSVSDEEKHFAEALKKQVEAAPLKKDVVTNLYREVKNLTAGQAAYLGNDVVTAMEARLEEMLAKIEAEEKKADEKKKTTIKASATTAKKGKKTVIKLTADSGAKLTVTGTNANAKNKKFVKIKNGKTAKLTFTKKAKKGKYTFKVTCPANGTYLAATKTIKIRVK